MIIGIDPHKASHTRWPSTTISQPSRLFAAGKSPGGEHQPAGETREQFDHLGHASLLSRDPA